MKKEWSGVFVHFTIGKQQFKMYKKFYFVDTNQLTL